MRFPIVAVLVFFFTVSAAPRAVAQLPDPGEKLKEKYQEERSRGLIKLNERYIALYKRELAAATQRKEFEKATAMLTEIEGLLKEIEDIQSALGGKPEKERFSILGKKARFGSNVPPHHPLEIEFKSGGKAIFVGLNRQAVEWQYEQSPEPHVYYFWGPRQEQEEGWKLELDEDGETGVATQLKVDFTTDAVLSNAKD